MPARFLALVFVRHPRLSHRALTLILFGGTRQPWGQAGTGLV